MTSHSTRLGGHPTFRKPVTLILAVLGSATLPALVPAVAGAKSAPSARAAATGAKVQVRHTRRGDLLVNGRGFTLYTFSRDARNRDRCVQINGCRGIWLVDTTHGRPVAGRGVRGSLLGTTRVGRATQVTYAGHPLYTYVADSNPGQTFYVGVSQFGGKWLGIRTSGRQIG
jgi:predicted lipoprotein with Yx(FWY)xxD motif